MPRGKPHSTDTKAQAKALLLAGESVMEVSRQLELPNQTVSDIKASLTDKEFGILRAKKGSLIEELVTDYLAANLRALRAQAEIAGERAYIQKQPAGELSLLHGVMSDKSVRLLEALQRASDATEAGKQRHLGEGAGA